MDVSKHYFLVYSPIEYEYVQFLNRSLWPLDVTLTRITTPGQSSGNENLLQIY